MADGDLLALAGDDVAFARVAGEADIDPGVDAAADEFQRQRFVGHVAAVPLPAEDHAGVGDQAALAGVVEGKRG